MKKENSFRHSLFYKLEVIYLHNQSKSFCNYCNDKLHNEGFRLNLYSVPNRPIFNTKNFCQIINCKSNVS